MQNEFMKNVQYFTYQIYIFKIYSFEIFLNYHQIQIRSIWIQDDNQFINTTILLFFEYA